MKAKPPPARKKFKGPWDEVGYLYDKLLYWLYGREAAAKALPFADRLVKLLPQVTPDHEAIFGEECWSLVYETKGDFRKAIQHRENEIRLIRRLHAISRGKPNEQIIIRIYDYNDLSDRLDLLATLYHEKGDLDKAIAVVRESKQLCKTHGVRFDGADLLRDYLEEKAEVAALTNGKAVTGKKARTRSRPLANVVAQRR